MNIRATSVGVVERLRIAGSRSPRLCCLVLAAIFGSVAGAADAASNINTSNPYSYGANIGWMNWRPSAGDGVTIGEYICSGYIYGANVGWINLGSGSPTNQIQYSNSSAADFGVNYSIDPAQPGRAILRGYAYGANIGWINFESSGNPRIRFSDGRLEGYAYSANCGWINLGDGSFAVQADNVANGGDSDGDGMADAFEFLYLGGLGGLPNADSDGDGVSNLAEYKEGTAANSPTSVLRITNFSTNSTGTTSPVTWTSNVSRLYAIDINPDLLLMWTDSGLGVITPAAGSQTTRTVTTAAGAKRFYRVRAIRPLAP